MDMGIILESPQWSERLNWNLELENMLMDLNWSAIFSIDSLFLYKKGSNLMFARVLLDYRELDVVAAVYDRQGKEGKVVGYWNERNNHIGYLQRYLVRLLNFIDGYLS